MNQRAKYEGIDDLLVDEPGSADYSSRFDPFDLDYCAYVLRRRMWPILLFTAAITALATYLAQSATPVYQATSTLLIEPERTNVSVEELIDVKAKNLEYYTTQYELLRSQGLAERVLGKLSLWETIGGPLPGFSDVGDAGSEPSGIEASDPDLVIGTRAWLGTLARRARTLLAEVGIVELPPEELNLEELLGEPAGSGAVEGLEADMLADEDGAAGMYLTPDERRRQRVLGWFANRLSVKPVRDTNLVRISFESKDPELAASIANAVGEEYIGSYLDQKAKLTTRASGWLDARLQSLKRELDESEARLQEFKRANDLIDVDGSVGRLNEQELLLSAAELAQARTELASAADIYRETQALRGDVELVTTIPAVQADSLVQRAKIDLSQAERELDELLNRYGERHPRVVDVKSRIASLTFELRRHVDRVVGAIEKNYQLLQRRLRSIEIKLDRGKEAIQTIGTKKFELEALEREVKINRELHNTFFNRMTEARSVDGLEAANARLVDIAAPPANPFKPRKRLIIALAALGSLALSLLLAFLYERMDDSVKSARDVERKLGLELLGILPQVKSGILSLRGSRLPLNPTRLQDRERRFSEAVDSIRTTLLTGDSADKKVLVVTSSIPGEGKSTSAINLAHSLSQLERVLLIDCDLRRPTVARTLGLDCGAPGLSSLITGTAIARDCMQRGVLDGAIDVLPSGPPTSQPLELLFSARFRQLLEQLATYYDRIVIDSAPTQAVSDALVLGKLADAVIYVVHSHSTSLELIKQGVQRLRHVNAYIAGVIITQVDVDRLKAYGGKYQYLGYYDRYGYGKNAAAADGRGPLSQEELGRVDPDATVFHPDADREREGASAVVR